jgi:predicted amidohydrolase
VRALLAQLASVPGRTQTNADRAVEILRAHPNVDIAVFPELFLGGYDLSLVPQSARAPDSSELQSIAAAAAAASTAVVVGFAERAAEDSFFNSVACIDRDGSLAGVYRKTRLFGTEPAAFRAGDEQRVFRLCGLDVGPLICFDIEFPEPARAAVRAGAEVLVTPSANMAPYWADHELASRARALDNRVAHLYANRVGSESGHRFVGGSRAIAPDGAVLVEASEEHEELLVMAVGHRERPDAAVDYLRHARGELPVRAAVPSSPPGGSP